MTTNPTPKTLTFWAAWLPSGHQFLTQLGRLIVGDTEAELRAAIGLASEPLHLVQVVGLPADAEVMHVREWHPAAGLGG